MPIQTYKVKVPELNRSCITTVVELPLDSEMYYNVPADCQIVGISISPVKDHSNMLSIGIMIAEPEKEHTTDA